jgi:hypothetical protein
MSALMAEKCNSLSHFVDIVYSCFLIMYCIVSYCVLCLYLICYLYTNVSTMVTRNKDIYIYILRLSLDICLTRQGNTTTIEALF